MLEVRLSAVQECIKRTRLALLVCFFAALVSLISLCNSEFSLDKLSFFDSQSFSETDPALSMSQAEKDAERRCLASGNLLVPVLASKECQKILDDFRSRNNVREAMTASLVSHWLDGVYVSIPLLGVRVSVHDFSIYNSLAMLLLTTYFMLSERRENREIGSLLRDVAKGEMYMRGLDVAPKKEAMMTVYRSICAFMIFNVPTTDDRPQRHLNETTNDNSNSRLEWWMEIAARINRDISYGSALIKRLILQGNPEPRAKEDNKGHLVIGLRGLISCIYFLPFASIAADIAFQIRHVGSIYAIWQWGAAWKTGIIAVVLLEGACFAFVLYFTLYIRLFNSATRSILSEFKTASSLKQG